MRIGAFRKSNTMPHKLWKTNRILNVRVAIGLLLFTAISDAAPLTVTISPTIFGPTSNLLSYSYNLVNDESSSENVFAFAVVTSGPIIGTLVVPAGWTPDLDSTPGLIVWTSDDAMFDLMPGHSLTFGFMSPYSPAADQFLAFGSDPVSGFPTGDLATGLTVGPVATPEPCSILLFCLGLTVIACLTFVRLRALRLRMITSNISGRFHPPESRAAGAVRVAQAAANSANSSANTEVAFFVRRWEKVTLNVLVSFSPLDV
jgi:hypothetical protein